MEENKRNTMDDMGVYLKRAWLGTLATIFSVAALLPIWWHVSPSTFIQAADKLPPEILAYIQEDYVLGGGIFSIAGLVILVALAALFWWFRYTMKYAQDEEGES